MEGIGNLVSSIQQTIEGLLMDWLKGTKTWKEHEAIVKANRELDAFLEQHRERMRALLPGL